MMDRCQDCGCQGTLVMVVCSMSDTREVLDTALLCPECFHGGTFADTFGMGVICRDEAGTLHVRGRPPDMSPRRLHVFGGPDRDCMSNTPGP